MFGNLNRRVAIFVQAAILIIDFTAADASFGQTFWIGSVGDWFDGFNWSNGVPHPNSPTSFDAQINNVGVSQIFSPGASVRRLTLGTFGGQAGGLLVDAGSLNVTENLRLGEFGGMGNMTIRNDADVSAGVTILGVVSGSGLMTVSGNGSTLAQHTLILGELASGTMIVREGADVSGFHISLANIDTSAFGRLTVTGAGSTVAADDTLWIGRTGVGELTVDTGGAVTAPTIDIGSNAFGSGLVAIIGTGSVLTSANTLLVGNNGSGTMNISDGGRVNSIAMAVGFASGGGGTVTVTGSGSRLVDTFNSIHVGEAGGGTLNIADGGAVTVGNGVGSLVVGAAASGPASTLRIGTGGAPGTLEAGSVSLFRANSLLELNHTGVIALTMPIRGPGSVTQIGNGTTTFTANNSFTGPLTVSSGLVEVSAGGQINNAAESNIADGVGQVASMRIIGAGSKWTNTGSTFIGAVGTGSVAVENGGELRADAEILVNRFANGNGNLTVTGAGSKAMTSGEFRIADEGLGLVRVEAGGAVSGGGNMYLGRNTAAANGTAVINGAGSTWTTGGHMIVGNLGTGTLRIENAGMVSSGFGEIGRLGSSTSSATVTGAGSLWNVTSFLLVGDEGSGTLRIENGGKVRHVSSGGYVGTSAGSMGTVEIVGPGSAWEPTFLSLGTSSNGIVTVSGGGAVTTGGTFIGVNTLGNGLAVITGPGSTWTSSGPVEVGSAGVGDLRIADGAVFSAGGGAGAVNVAVQPGSIGLLRIGTGAAPGTLNAGSVVFGQGATALLSFNHTGDLTFPIPISGAGVIHKQAAGTTTLTANNSYSLGSRIFDGVLRTNNPSGQGLGTGPIYVETRFANLHFIGSAVAGANSVMNNNRVAFFDASSAGTATIDNSGGSSLISPGQTDFNGNATAAAASITNRGSTMTDVVGGRTVFLDNATAQASTILNQSGTTVFFAGGGQTEYRGNSTAGAATITNFGESASVAAGGRTFFWDHATAGAATIYNEPSSSSAASGNVGWTLFNGNSSAGNAVIHNKPALNSSGNGGLTSFNSSTSTAGNATIYNYGGGSPGARGGGSTMGGTAGNATIVSEGGAADGAFGGTTRVHGNAGAPTITNQAATAPGGLGGTLNFAGLAPSQFANGGSATITNQGAGIDSAGGGQTTFERWSTAGNATITNIAGAAQNALGGVTTFEDTADAGTAVFNNQGAGMVNTRGGVVRFIESANAGTATLNNFSATAELAYAGSIEFRASSSAASATINNRGSAVNAQGGQTSFWDSATASNSTILNEGGAATTFASGQTVFFDQSSAGSAAITMTGGTALNTLGGDVDFSDQSNAANATLVALGGTNGGSGGQIILRNQANGGNATVRVEGNGAFSIESLLTPGTTVGSISGSGRFGLGTKFLTVGGNNTSTAVLGVISGNGGGITKVGVGTLTLAGTNSYTGATLINDGRLQVDSALPSDATVSKGSLAGIGPFNGSVRVGTLFGPDQAFLDPGASVGTMTVTNTLNFAAFGAYRWELDSNTTQADRIVATAGVNLNFGGSSRLIPVDLGTASLPPGFTFAILDKQSAGPISGTFVGLAEGAEFDLGANRFRISYVGGNGNDLTLVTIPTLEGDFNDNGAVDAADYVLWRDKLGTAFALPNETLTLGIVTAEDFGTWRANFGRTASSAAGINANAAVPEPATLLVIVMGTLTICSCRGAAVS